MKKTSPLALVGLYFIQRAAPGFHGRIIAEAVGPWVTAEVCAWGGDHRPVTLRLFSADDARSFDFYRMKREWDAAIAEVVKANERKTTA